MSLPSPLSILFYTLAITALASLYVLGRDATDRQSRAFGLAALSLIASLDVMSLLAGFSIGTVMAVVAIPLALLLAWGSGTFRMPLALMAVATVLMALALVWGNTFRTVQWTLGFGLGAVGVLALMRMVQFWDTRDSGEFGGWSLALAAALGGMGLIFSINDPSGIGLWAARLGALAAATLTFFSPRYQLGLVAVALLNALLAIGLSGF
jgi:hypothetical protein